MWASKMEAVQVDLDWEHKGEQLDGLIKHQDIWGEMSHTDELMIKRWI